jgi:hypothetical protein
VNFESQGFCCDLPLFVIDLRNRRTTQSPYVLSKIQLFRASFGKSFHVFCSSFESREGLL